MAGAGYKLFNTGDVLTAQQVNEYLQQQTVMVFANSTARTTALSGVLAEGMMSYLQDTNSVEVYNGSAWVSVSSDQIPLTTKGDLLTYSTTDTRLGVGTNGQVLTADSSQSTGLAWTTISSGAFTLLSTTSLSGTSTTISSISQSYTNLMVVVYQVNINTGTSNFRVAPNGTTNIVSIKRDDQASGRDALTNSYLTLNTAGSVVTNGNTNNGWVFTINNYTSAFYKPISGSGTYMDTAVSGNPWPNHFGGAINTTSAITSLVFSNSGGYTFAGGTVLVYGVK